MSDTVRAIEAEALKLSPEERAALIERLAATIAPAAPLHPAWEAEIAQRLADLEAGLVELLDGCEVFTAVRARINAHAPT